MSWPATLSTKRLILRPWTEEDAEALVSLAADASLGWPAIWPLPKTIEDARRIIRECLSQTQTYAITLRDSPAPDVPVGIIGLNPGATATDAPDGRTWLDYAIAESVWDKGLIPEAVRAVMRHAFEDLGSAVLWTRGSKADGTDDGSCLTHDAWEVLQEADPVDDETIDAQQEEAHEIIDGFARIARIRSGGQTGADRGALDAAREAGVPICGWCPPGGRAEDRMEPPGVMADYPELKEGSSEGYVERTALNVRDSHATLIVAPTGIEPRSGTDLTMVFAAALGRPRLVIRGCDDIDRVRSWLKGLGRGLTLNVAGPRESKTPGTYAVTRQVVSMLLAE